MAAKRNSKNSKDVFAKKVPQNPRYKHVKSVLDTGASVTNYLSKIEEIRKNYRFRKDEIFKRMKASTFVQLILQVAEVVNIELERQFLESAETAADENANIENGEDLEENKEADRMRLENLINGLGEVDHTAQYTAREEDDAMSKLTLQENDEKESVIAPDPSSLPFLLLDVREKDLYDQCHIIGALNYPSAMLTRSVNYLTKEMLEFKNKEGKIIIFYDEDEKLAPHCATVLVQREIDNVIMLSGGMKVLNKKFPGCFMAGTIPRSCFSPPTERKGKKTKSPPQVTENVDLEWYTPELLEKMQDLLEDILLEGDSSRMSSRSTVRSTSTKATGRLSTTSTVSKTSRNTPAVWK